ncbi:hypothetical protein RBU49_02855 [Clostridium sp. MB40-C1]|uniref:hypothetical protein n=1 Tax=Clostridium sp. MB40-C1 TaxID=3070996 RepID=UPI0027E01856|nr:hypothetical protein [Clostridium sp. MB40-C1]WMJ81209.1 hypothetical protein RBU49_02855 [Clostridium sp. MB40-C1]
MSNDKDNRGILNEDSSGITEEIQDDYLKCKQDAEEKIKASEKKLKESKKMKQDASSSSGCIDDELTCLTKKLVEINTIREEITKLRLDPAKRTFFTNDIEPLLRTLDTLSLSTERFALAIYNIYGNNFTKFSEMKDMLNLVYSLSDKSEEVLKVLNKEIDIMLNIYKCDFKK